MAKLIKHVVSSILGMWARRDSNALDHLTLYMHGTAEPISFHRESRNTYMAFPSLAPIRRQCQRWFVHIDDHCCTNLVFHQLFVKPAIVNFPDSLVFPTWRHDSLSLYSFLSPVRVCCLRALYLQSTMDANEASLEPGELHDEGKSSHDTKAKGGITLIPQPSDDPQDPLVSTAISGSCLWDLLTIYLTHIRTGVLRRR